MSLYFLLLDAEVFHKHLRPMLIASWRQRSFAPCRTYCGQLQAQAYDFSARYHLGTAEPLLAAVARSDLPFDRLLWQHLAGELLWYGAADIPEISTSPEALVCLVPDRRIVQALNGSGDLAFGGGYYRPDQAGWNDLPDVRLLADFLGSLRPGDWHASALAGMDELADEVDRAEELEFVRDWFPELVQLYRDAAGQRQIVVCERLS
jgi:hypothetical protein